MHIQVITLFPEEFQSMVQFGVTGRAIRAGLVRLEVLNPRDFATDRHRSVDDRPYGGGPGMVMRVEPLREAIRAARHAAGAGRESGDRAAVALMSPQGRVLEQETVRALARRGELILVCGRYEGVDERLIEQEVDEEWSLGDYVLSGGELAAAVLVDAVARLVPGVLGDDQSAAQDSFSAGLLDCPHYTRPEEIEGRAVPEVLLSGDHEAIRRWRRKQALGRTWQRRPDLLGRVRLSPEDEQLLAEFRLEHGDSSEPGLAGEEQRHEQHHR
jgi:tRNA (guanine37-N1)-methyltransferase